MCFFFFLMIFRGLHCVQRIAFMRCCFFEPAEDSPFDVENPPLRARVPWVLAALSRPTPLGPRDEPFPGVCECVFSVFCACEF